MGLKSTKWLSPVEKTERYPNLFKLAVGSPHDIDTIRIVDIGGFDRQADSDGHVENLKELARLNSKMLSIKGRTLRECI